MPQELPATEALHDDGSDYGDFTLDEEAVINELLSNIPPGNTTADEPLVLTDIEDYDEPAGIRLPKILGKEIWVDPRVQQQPHPKVAVGFTTKQALRDSNTFAKGNFLTFERVMRALTC
jgi:hypothetical protein